MRERSHSRWEASATLISEASRSRSYPHSPPSMTLRPPRDESSIVQQTRRPWPPDDWLSPGVACAVPMSSCMPLLRAPTGLADTRKGTLHRFTPQRSTASTIPGPRLHGSCLTTNASARKTFRTPPWRDAVRRATCRLDGAHEPSPTALTARTSLTLLAHPLSHHHICAALYSLENLFTRPQSRIQTRRRSTARMATKPRARSRPRQLYGHSASRSADPMIAMPSVA